MKKNDIINEKVTSLGGFGEGIIKNDEGTIFVPYCLPNEQIEAQILKVNKNIAFAKVNKVITKSEDRVTPPCKVFEKCGGCNVMHVSYQKQLEYKQNLIKDRLKRTAFIDYEVKNTVESDLQLRYRNKLQLPIRKVNGQIKIGFFALNSHRVVDIDDCLLQPIWVKTLIAILRDYVEKYKISCYDDITCKGLLKHVVVKEHNNSFIIILVSTKKDVPNIKYFVRKIRESFNNCSIFLNINNKNNNVVLGDEYLKLFGSGEIECNSFGIKYTVNAQSFTQVNDNVKQKLYSDVAKLCCSDKKGIVIDAYCGAGLLTAILSKQFDKAYGIEIVQEAIDSANKLANDNGIENVSFICGACEQKLPILLDQIKNENKPITLVLDPPRKGIDVALLKVIQRVKFDKIVYVSCNPQTLARDLGIIMNTLKFVDDGGIVNNVESSIDCNQKNNLPYKITYACGYDMFAQTSNVESVVCLQIND